MATSCGHRQGCVPVLLGTWNGHHTAQPHCLCDLISTHPKPVSHQPSSSSLRPSPGPPELVPRPRHPFLPQPELPCPLSSLWQSASRRSCPSSNTHSQKPSSLPTAIASMANLPLTPTWWTSDERAAPLLPAAAPCSRLSSAASSCLAAASTSMPSFPLDAEPG